MDNSNTEFFEFFKDGGPGDLMLQGHQDPRIVTQAARIVMSLGHDLTVTNVEQMLVYMVSMEVFATRNAQRNDLWRKGGWDDCIHHMRHKLMRIKDEFLGEDQDQSAMIADMDDAFDLINYTAFFIRNIREDNREGDGI